MGKLLLILLPPLLLLAACAASRAEALEARLARAETDLERGRAYYETSCNRCHSLYMPRSYGAEEWRFFVGKYGRKARLTHDERDLVLLYLRRNARD